MSRGFLMNESMNHQLELYLLPERYAVVRLAALSPVPSWAWRGTLNAVVRTEDELSIVCEQSAVPGDVKCEPDWIALKLQGPILFSTTGVLASLVNPLAAADIPVFAISTYDTDYILIKAEDLARARTVLMIKNV
jgi:hypothetical protein